jgi:hypothetical protein
MPYKFRITILSILFLVIVQTAWPQDIKFRAYLKADSAFDWIKTARVFLVDAYQPPFVPKLEFDAELLAKTMVEMHANVLRIGTMGKYATIKGVCFSTHPDQGDRDILQEAIRACKPRGIKVIPYISTGHKLAWSMLTKDYPDYAQKTSPNGGPLRLQMMIGEDQGTVCWMSDYRKAYFDLVEHVCRDYDIDGIYFDTWRPFSFWEGKQVCYCDGCTKGFRKATGLELPYHENPDEYTKSELETIDKYHKWYYEEYIKIVEQVCDLVRSYRKIPLIYNADNPTKIAEEDPRILSLLDAFLYERGNSMLERAEGVSLARALDLDVLPYIGVYNNWQRTVYETNSYQQQIFTNMMFGGGAIVAQPYAYTSHYENRKYVSYPFEIIEKHESLLKSLTNYKYVGVVYSDHNPQNHAKSSWWGGNTDSRTSTLGAFAACIYNHIQVSSIHEFLLDQPEKLKQFPVLYLADITYLSEERIKNLKDYVHNGGSLIVCYSTSLYDSSGIRRNSFGLEELIGVKPVIPEGNLKDEMRTYSTKIGGPSDLYILKIKNNGNLLGDFWNDRLVPLWFYEPVKAIDPNSVIMEIVAGDGPHTILPGVILNNYGKGKVLYSSSSLESLYLKDGKYILGDLIDSFIKAVSSVPAPYIVKAPSAVITNLSVSKNCWVLHITNWTGNKFERANVDDDYLAHVENFSAVFKIPANNQVKSVSCFVEAPFEKKIKGNQLEIKIPHIDAYQAIYIEFKQD